MTSNNSFGMLIETLYKAEYEKRFVCLVDILGYSNQIRESKKPMDLALITVLYNQFSLANCELGKKMCINIFSDSIYVAVKEENIDVLLNFISVLENQLLHGCDSEVLQQGKPPQVDKSDSYRHQLLRGGVTFSDVYVNEEENIIIGPGVLRAYELESKQAIYPRVIFDDAALKKIQESGSRFFENGSIAQDTDGRCYLDYLRYLDKYRGTKLDLSFRDRCIQWCDDNINKCSMIADKYQWQKKYLMKT